MRNSLYCLIAIMLMCMSKTLAQTSLPTNLFSQNGWLVDTVGVGTTTDTVLCTGLKAGYGSPCLVSVSNNIYKDNRLLNIKNSKARLIRYGGERADQNRPTPYQYLKFVDSVRARGMEPILQIPVNEGESGTNSTVPYDTIFAKTVIIYINQTHARNVIYWSIGNEPDKPIPHGYGYDSKEEAFLITTYIKKVSKAMRRAVPSVPIKIMGPELAAWTADPNYTMKKLVDSLITPGQRCDITGKDPATNLWWIDYFSFHSYSGFDGNNPSVSRATIIAKLRSATGLASTLSYLKLNLDTANTTHSRGASPLKIGITEAHLGTQSITNDAFNDVKCNGFIAGQYWLEIASIAAEAGVEFVNFWSANENSMGYLKTDGTKKSTYHHFKTVAENFAGLTDYYTGTDNQTNIKTFGAKGATGQITLVIMNQDTFTSAYKPYKIRLDNTTPSATTWIKMNMGSFSTEYIDTIDASSTTLLVFDLNGNISQKYRYKQTDGSGAVGFHQTNCSNSVTYADSTSLSKYYPATYSNITIGDASGAHSIIIGNGNNHIYRAVTSITLEKNVEIPLGQTLELAPSDCE